jgi:hypothetical protein
MANLTSVKIFPSIGIARMGNSQEWYIGAELPFPAPPPTPTNGTYKDNQCRIKREAQRFRLWGYYDDGTNRELTVADGQIQWTVHVANAKAVFQGEPAGQGLIDPGPRILNGANDSATFANGTYHNAGLVVEVPLGDASTDADGRLIVRGGFGFSSSPAGNSIVGFWQSPGWHDDVSDGPVNASIIVGGTPFQALGAWVICPPPRYAPSTYAPVTLYDSMREVAIENNLPGAPLAAMPPSFVNDIWPILLRGLGMLRVVAADFSPGDHGSLAQVIPPAAGQDAARAAILGKLAVPPNPPNIGLANQPANMPLQFTSGGPLGSNPADAPPALRKFQYAQMQSWAQAGSAGFVNDWPAVGQPAGPTVITPEGLTQAALENCIGAPFYPGIEATVSVNDGSLTYSEAFRLDQTHLNPGDLTKGMARPWQADFTACTGYVGADLEQWWPSARPVSVYTQQGSNLTVDWTNGLINGPEDMVANWFRLGFIVDPGDGLPVQTEFLAVCKDCFIAVDRNQIGKEEAQAAVNSHQSISDAFYLVIEGFAPSALGITHANPTPAELQGWFPTAITLSTLQPLQQMTAAANDLLLEDNGALGSAQRITIGYDISFSGINDFNFVGDAEPITINATVGTVAIGIASSSAEFDLTQSVAPYMDHGPISYLSNDTRVFKRQASDGAMFPALGGPTLGNDPNGFITAVINTLRNAASSQDAYNAFEGLPPTEAGADLEWNATLNGAPVFNFALCRVRYRATMTAAPNVRVFFRLFQTAATGTDYNAQTTYKWGGTPSVKIPLLGIQGGEVVTIPFFAQARGGVNANLNSQTDPINVQPINPDPGGKEVYMYYGAWLDINQDQPTDRRFPIQATSPAGPFPEFSGQNLLPIADLIRGTHQCMVTEIAFDGFPITDGTSTASSAMLSQRNLAIDDSENPGATASRRAQHTFTIRPTTGNPLPQQGPDEIMIAWGNTPVGTEATIYLPGVRASEVLALARKNFNLQTLEKVDDHTLRCRTAGVTYVPIPPGGTIDLAGLITLDLPAGIREGQTFRIVVRQIVDRATPPPPLRIARQGVRAAVAPPSKARYILGAFQFSVEVKKGLAILLADERKLIALKRVIATVPIENRWYPVLKRNFDQMLQRFTALGGDPGSILGTPQASTKCRALSALCAALLATFIVVLGVLTGAQQISIGAVTAVLFVAAMAIWIAVCAPRACRILRSSLLGSAIGAGALSILALLGLATAQLITILAIAVIVVALLAIVGVLKRCW